MTKQEEIREGIQAEVNIIIKAGSGICSDCYTDSILSYLHSQGYCKLPKDKPPLLGKIEMRMALKEADKYWASTENEEANGPILKNLKEVQLDFVAQAQREADIKHYEGK